MGVPQVHARCPTCILVNLATGEHVSGVTHHATEITDDWKVLTGETSSSRISCQEYRWAIILEESCFSQVLRGCLRSFCLLNPSTYYSQMAGNGDCLFSGSHIQLWSWAELHVGSGGQTLLFFCAGIEGQRAEQFLLSCSGRRKAPVFTFVLRSFPSC